MGRGIWSVLTNSNHQLVRELYADLSLQVVKTKRNISSDAATRNGEDVIVDMPPSRKTALIVYRNVSVPPQAKLYPPTRYMGSKRKLLGEICRVASQFDFGSVLDLFSGSGIVGYMFKSMGKSIFITLNANTYSANQLLHFVDLSMQTLTLRKAFRNTSPNHTLWHQYSYK